VGVDLVGMFHRPELGTTCLRLVEASLPCDLTATIQVARWVYQQTEKAKGQVWVVERVVRHLSPGWSQCLSLSSSDLPRPEFFN